MRDMIEFHLGEKIIAWAESSHAPDRGDMVNIRSTTYVVKGRTYTVDHADSTVQRSVVCVINLQVKP